MMDRVNSDYLQTGTQTASNRNNLQSVRTGMVEVEKFNRNNDNNSEFDQTWENFLKIHPFFQQEPFDIPTYCFEWKPEMSTAFDLYGGEIQQTIKEVNDPTNEREQPSLSLKLSFIQMAFQSMFTQLVNTFH